MPIACFGRDAAVRCNQRQFALERLLRGDQDAQRRALPRRHWRGQDSNLGRVFTLGPWSGFSAATKTRSGAPFHGAIGEGRTAISAASSHWADAACAVAAPVGKRTTRATPARGNNAVTAAGNRRH